MTLHEAFCELYGLLERTYFQGCPYGDPAKNCVMTGIRRAVCWDDRLRTDEDVALIQDMDLLLLKVTGARMGELSRWSDAGPKEKVLAAVAECIRRTAPEPADPIRAFTAMGNQDGLRASWVTRESGHVQEVSA